MIQNKHDPLSENAIRGDLLPQYRDIPILVFDEIDSTNTCARSLAADRCMHGCLVTADHQTAGRGRHGRSFYSPADTGIYMSVVLQHRRPIRESLMATVSAAVAVCRAIEALTEADVRIKWVNDVFVRQRKAVGILVEAITDFAQGVTEAMIVGIGVNLRTETFPEELRSIAGSLNSPCSRNALIARIASELLALTDEPDYALVMEEYRRRSLVLGREVAFTQNGITYRGIAEAINDAGNLEVRTPSGLMVLSAGEISLTEY